MTCASPVYGMQDGWNCPGRSVLFEIFDIILLAGMFVAFFASGMTAYAGFGGALVMVPLFTLLIGPVQAIALMALCSAVALIHVIPGLFRVIRWREVLPLVVGLFVSISVASGYLVTADAGFVRLCMGVFVLLSAAILILDLRYSGPRGPVPSFVIGMVTGAIMGGVGVPAGPVMVIYFLAAQEPAPVQRANIMVSVWLLLVIMLVSLLGREAIEVRTALSAGLIAPASILGASLGQYLFRRAPMAWFKTFAHGLLVVIGVAMLVI